MKITKTISTLMSFTLLVSAASGAERAVLQVDWSQFQEQVRKLNLSGHKAQIRLSGGEQLKGNVYEVTGDGLSVQSGRRTRGIAREDVASVRFDGRTGNKGRIIGTAVGAGVGTAIGASAIHAGRDITEGGFSIIIPAAGVGIIAIGSVLGYYIGRDRDRQVPEFVLTH